MEAELQNDDHLNMHQRLRCWLEFYGWSWESSEGRNFRNGRRGGVRRWQHHRLASGHPDFILRRAVGGTGSETETLSSSARCVKMAVNRIINQE